MPQARQLPRRVCRVDDGHNVCRLRVIQLKQLRSGERCCDFIRHARTRLDDPAVLVDAHVEVAELKDVGLLVVELKRDQAGRAAAFGLVHEHGARAILHAAVGHDEEVRAQAQAGLVTGQVDARIERRRQFTGRERRLNGGCAH